MIGTDIAIDLGTANFKLFLDGTGVVVNEPNVIAVDAYTDRVVAVGREAYAMIGRTSDRVRVVKPMAGGVISDFSLMDAMVPGIEAIGALLADRNDASCGELFAAAADAAEKGAESTKELRAKYGRAKNLGDRSAGHIDAGATSMALIFRAFAEAGAE